MARKTKMVVTSTETAVIPTMERATQLAESATIRGDKALLTIDGASVEFGKVNSFNEVVIRAYEYLSRKHNPLVEGGVYATA